MTRDEARIAAYRAYAVAYAYRKNRQPNSTDPKDAA